MKPTLQELTFNLKESHLRQGKQNNCKYCPLALALKEAYPHLIFEVHRGWVTVQDQHFRYLFYLTQELQVLIDKFDSGQVKLIHPGSFTLRCPATTLPVSR